MTLREHLTARWKMDPKRRCMDPIEDGDIPAASYVSLFTRGVSYNFRLQDEISGWTCCWKVEIHMT